MLACLQLTDTEENDGISKQIFSKKRSLKGILTLD